jgi:N-acetylmuramoyl-L-alanine amidase
MARINLANDNNADYYIAIHADGVDNYTSSGSHVIYPNTNDSSLSANCSELAKDILSLYNIVAVESESPKIDVRGLQVLSTTNKTDRKVLVELGFVTTPKDARKLYPNVSVISQQLYNGLLTNIEKSF